MGNEACCMQSTINLDQLKRFNLPWNLIACAFLFLLFERNPLRQGTNWSSFSQQDALSCELPRGVSIVYVNRVSPHCPRMHKKVAPWVNGGHWHKVNFSLSTIRAQASCSDTNMCFTENGHSSFALPRGMSYVLFLLRLGCIIAFLLTLKSTSLKATRFFLFASQEALKIFWKNVYLLGAMPLYYQNDFRQP